MEFIAHNWWIWLTILGVVLSFYLYKAFLYYREFTGRSLPRMIVEAIGGFFTTGFLTLERIALPALIICGILLLLAATVNLQ